jgi:asparagine synthase (glutamine-hydrolysing)
MCGIAGVIGAGATATTVESMTRLLRHRGPDDRGLWHEGDACLGHTRLSIIDLSPAGHQPMELGDLVVTYNGEIYNFRELRSRLPGPFKSSSDTEVLLHLYREHGERCVEHLQGMFAFAIWDRRRRRLFGARDHLGIKPFHYAHTGSSFAFASELDALLAAVPSAVDPSAIVDYLTYGYVPTPKTIYAGLRKLPPAHAFVLEDGKLRTWRYWTPSCETRITDMPTAVARTEALLEEIVPAQLVSDVPIGVFLSGGIDSATIASFAGRISTFTLGFEDRSVSEADAARSVATHLGTNHHELTANARDVRTAIDTVARSFGEPFGDNAAWSSYLVSQRAREHVTVALSGEGGDELFGGYERYWKLQARQPRRIATTLGKILRPTSRLGRSMHKRAATGLPAAAMREAGLVGPSLDAILSPALVEPGYDRLWSYRQFWREELHPTQRLRWMELHTTLPDALLTKVDRSSMAHSLEVRPPLLDHRLVEFAFGLDPVLLVDPVAARGKLVLRELMRDRLPGGHLDRPKKGFGLPIRRWLRQDTEYVTQAMTTLLDAGILRRPVDHRFDKIWLLLVLARWIELRG